MAPNERKLYFETLSEGRVGYFVDYFPAGGDSRFATLSLTFLDDPTPSFAKRSMQREARVWLERYPVPIMVSASDDKNDIIQLGDDYRDNYLFAWFDGPNDILEFRWGLVEDDELPDVAYSLKYLQSVYADVPYRTKDEVQRQASESSQLLARNLRTGIVFLTLWAVVVPSAVAFLGWANRTIGLGVFVYAVVKAGIHGGRILGVVRPSRAEKLKRERRRRMEHYYYHCERNPEGFARLRAENFEKEERELNRGRAKELGVMSDEPLEEIEASSILEAKDDVSAINRMGDGNVIMSRLRYFLVGVLILGVVLLGGYGVYRAFGYLYTTFTTVDATIIGAFVAALTAVFGYMYTQSTSKSRDIAQAQRPGKVEVYSTFMDVLVKVLQLSRQESGTGFKDGEMPKDVEDLVMKFNRELILWGSPMVIKSWAEFRRKSTGVREPLQVLLAMDDVLRSIRADLRNKNLGLKKGDLVKIFLRDPSEIDRALKSQTPSG